MFIIIIIFYYYYYYFMTSAATFKIWRLCKMKTEKRVAWKGTLMQNEMFAESCTMYVTELKGVGPLRA